MPNGDLRAVQLYGKSCNKPHHVDRFNLFVCKLLIGEAQNKKEVYMFFVVPLVPLSRLFYFSFKTVV